MLNYPLDGEAILRNKRSLKKQLLKEGLLEKRVAVLSGTTVGDIGNILELFLLDGGIQPIFFIGEYARYYEEIIFDDGALRAFSPDVIYLHTGIHNITCLPRAGDDKTASEQKFDTEWERIKTVFEAAKRYNCPVIANNFEFPSVRILGNRENYDAVGKVRFINRLNLRLADYAAENSHLLIHDINYLSSWYGLQRWSDPGYYNSYKYGLSPDAIPLLCLSVSSIIKSIFGRRRKALMLDLDNTLWGGVVGDDGVEGIKLGVESPNGMAFLDMQSYAKELRDTGVLLGVLSKNEETAAKEGFSHPSSVLSADDFSVFYANWNEKPENLQKAAAALNLGSDSFVFADDNPFERDLMTGAGLGVAVAAYTLPERFPENLSMSGYFEVTELSEDDRKRAEMYRVNQARETARAAYTNYGDYLDSLEMTAYLSTFSPERQQRITQLANKTNQFNLMTRRYTPEEIAKIEQSKDYIKIAARLTDRFGDNGLVAELAARIGGDTAVVELFLMSCRVFQRDLELVMFDELVNQAAARGVRTIRGEYIPTKKNGIVRDLYPSLGFETKEKEGRSFIFEYSISDGYKKKNMHIEVKYE